MSVYIYIKITYNHIHSHYTLCIKFFILIFNFPNHSCINTKYFIMIIENNINGEKMKM